MKYQIRMAEKEDFPAVKILYKNARSFMASHGNPNQWGSCDPSDEVIADDIRGGNLWLLYNETGIHGVFMFRIFEDPTYAVIENGAWHRDQPYGVIHRVAGDGSGGILQAAASWAGKKINYLRIDTHEANDPMQRAILSQGFLFCGTIYTEKGDKRLAYDRVK